ncbi:hypothetical protein IL306_012660 [Fusarium sp. DS 682]|nr:hypothetical protein IL306_012660 [Fusarium sp. DS 682]
MRHTSILINNGINYSKHANYSKRKKRNMAHTPGLPASASEPVKDTEPGRSPLVGTETVGTEPIEKKQPWRDIVQQEKFAQPSFFKGSQATAGNSKIRLLQEFDNKSR